MGATDLEPIRARDYTPEQVITALSALALHGGNAQAAHDLLQEQWEDVPGKDTITLWARKHPNRYAHIQAELAPKLELAAVDNLRASITYAGQVEHKLLTRLHDEAEAIPTKEIAGALRNVTTSKGINTDKLLALTGRPSTIIEHRSDEERIKGATETLTKLLSSVPSTAEEIPEHAVEG